MNDTPSYLASQVGDLLGPILDRVENGLPAEHISFGLPELDHLTGNGLAPGKLIVIAGHSSHGSSTLAFDIARNASVIEDVTTHLVTLTATPEETTRRILAAQAGVPIVRLTAAGLDDQDALRLKGAVNDMRSAPLYISEDHFVNHVGTAARAGKAPITVIDGAHLLHNERFFGETEEGRLEDIARELKQRTKRGMSIIATVPLTGGFGRQAPHLNHFGKFHPFVAWADMVLLTYRPDAVEREDPRAGEIDITVAKHRNGPTGVVTACFQAPYGRIRSFTK